MAKRLFDIFIALLALSVLSPLIVLCAIGIKLSSSGPILYRAVRVGQDGQKFSMLKLRTMRIESDHASAITAPGDSRVFGFGKFIRMMKMDELPQFWNILVGDMSVVGPRPEAADIVDSAYTDWMHETLKVRPGVTSPGAIYNYLMSDTLINPEDPERSYAERMLPPKLALELAYIQRASFAKDFGYVALTSWAVIANALGLRARLPAVDVEGARKWAPQGPYPNART